MSIWTRIAEALAALTSGEGLSSVFERLRTPPERTIAFTIAVIALGAKMAKADGTVTRDEVAAFREVFTIAQEDEAQAARVFNLARQDVAGFDAYARKIAAMFGPGHPALADLLEGLIYVAVADETYHPSEDIFLAEVARIFAIPERTFRATVLRFSADGEADPYAILGVAPDAHLDEVRAVWRRAVKDYHPDRMAARGLPEEAVKLGEKHLIAVNQAWEKIQRLHAL